MDHPTQTLAPDLAADLDVVTTRPAVSAEVGEALRRLAAPLLAAEDAGREPDPGYVAALTAAAADAPPDRVAPLLILLGVAAETGPGAHHAVRTGLDRYLAAGSARRTDPVLACALLYLLGHFPEDRAAIPPVADALPVSADDRSRLDRELAAFDPGDPAIGRVWPAPSDWELSSDERARDAAWLARLDPDRVRAMWRSDTRTLLAYSGAKALWAVEHGMPGYRPAGVVPPQRSGPHAPPDAHAAALRCPSCRGGLTFTPAAAHCSACTVEHPVRDGILDLSAGVGDATAEMTRNVPLRYDQVLRPAFIRFMGGNWAGVLPVEDEDAYLAEHVRPGPGPVLDVGAGTGRWTSVLAERFGAGDVLAVDLNAAMLGRLRAALPDVPAVRAGALALPLADASMGAVVCWNALQALPDASAVIGEIGRVLMPGGTFSLLTFRGADDPLYRRFQTRPDGVVVFDPDELAGMCAAAGMTVADMRLPGNCVIATFVRA
ncbi:class I SAM-dependent methyltransferase [Thermopolyspora sp. NPDC052614]|uniref:class I SAM-dependent methyltransferase n=1 Tax=Thermopolyspora sp. NPDC052614 TaxID=3155682 RepID=UPI00342F0609